MRASTTTNQSRSGGNSTRRAGSLIVRGGGAGGGTCAEVTKFKFLPTKFWFAAGPMRLPLFSETVEGALAGGRSVVARTVDGEGEQKGRVACSLR